MTTVGFIYKNYFQSTRRTYVEKYTIGLQREKTKTKTKQLQTTKTVV